MSKRRWLTVFKCGIDLCLLACITTFIGFYGANFTISDGQTNFHIKRARVEKSLAESDSGLENDEKIVCGHKNVTLSPVPLPVTALVSFPGSGSTWVRHLVQQLTGKL